MLYPDSLLVGLRVTPKMIMMTKMMMKKMRKMRKRKMLGTLLVSSLSNSL
jgi:hypothetical protein